MKIDPNAPAFPQNPEWSSNRGGLTIRAELAARAMQGMLMNPYWDESSYRKIAEEAVHAADALIAALNESEARDE